MDCRRSTTARRQLRVRLHLMQLRLHLMQLRIKQRLRLRLRLQLGLGLGLRLRLQLRLQLGVGLWLNVRLCTRQLHAGRLRRALRAMRAEDKLGRRDPRRLSAAMVRVIDDERAAVKTRLPRPHAQPGRVLAAVGRQVALRVRLLRLLQLLRLLRLLRLRRLCRELPHLPHLLRLCRELPQLAGHCAARVVCAKRLMRYVRVRERLRATKLLCAHSVMRGHASAAEAAVRELLLLLSLLLHPGRHRAAASEAARRGAAAHRGAR